MEDHIELTVYDSISKKIPIKTRSGRTLTRTIKKSIECKTTFIRGSCLLQQLFNTKGELYPNKCGLMDIDTRATYIVKGSYNSVYNLLHPKRVVVKGFIQ